MTADTPTAAASTAPATGATVHRMLASGLAEGLPVPVLATVDQPDAVLHLALASVDDVHTWQRWFAGHGAGPLIVHIADEPERGWRRHEVAGPWRGWELTLAHVTRQPEGGEQR